MDGWMDGVVTRCVTSGAAERCGLVGQNWVDQTGLQQQKITAMYHMALL